MQCSVVFPPPPAAFLPLVYGQSPTLRRASPLPATSSHFDPLTTRAGHPAVGFILQVKITLKQYIAHPGGNMSSLFFQTADGCCRDSMAIGGTDRPHTNRGPYYRVAIMFSVLVHATLSPLSSPCLRVHRVAPLLVMCRRSLYTWIGRKGSTLSAIAPQQKVAGFGMRNPRVNRSEKKPSTTRSWDLQRSGSWSPTPLVSRA